MAEAGLTRREQVELSLFLADLMVPRWKSLGLSPRFHFDAPLRSLAATRAWLEDPSDTLLVAALRALKQAEASVYFLAARADCEAESVEIVRLGTALSITAYAIEHDGLTQLLDLLLAPEVPHQAILSSGELRDAIFHFCVA